jgi:hypothetical protein
MYASASQRDFRASERLSLDCVAMIDRLCDCGTSSSFNNLTLSTPNTGSSCIPLLLTELSLAALDAFAAQLLRNGKYLYAILAYTANLSILLLRGRSKEHQLYLKKVALVAAENSDSRRAIRLYNDILRRYIQDKKMNEVTALPSL